MTRHEFPTPAAVTAALGTLDYPISKQEAIRRIGSWEIPCARDLRVPLADLLRGVPAETFGDARAAAAAVDRQWGRIARNLETVERAERAAAGRRAP